MDAKAGWVQQFHVGVTRNNNTAMLKSLGVDAGFDSIDDASFCRGMNSFLDRLNSEGCLAKTILYNLNPKDNAMMVSTAYNFNDGSVPGKIQYGSGWRFLDQTNGMEDPLNILSALEHPSRLVGMLTHSPQFL